MILSVSNSSAEIAHTGKQTKKDAMTESLALLESHPLYCRFAVSVPRSLKFFPCCGVCFQCCLFAGSHPLFRRCAHCIPWQRDWPMYAGAKLGLDSYPDRHYSWITDVKPRVDEAWAALRAKYSFLTSAHRLGVECVPVCVTLRQA